MGTIRTVDKDAFFDLHATLYYPLVNFGIRVCADADTASEATDLVFTTIWKNMKV
ncbi:hypothetical protein ACUN24_07950 [Pedobacter sp. WC2501]|uniref:hypothetical protein n=1 Tax=Pedobacter sp. WC2501 TaxID=3461400 RepID=UPI0040466705